MSLLDEIRNARLRSSHISRDTSAPVLQGEFDSISSALDKSVLDCTLERWAPLLSGLTAETAFVELTIEHARALVAAYEDAERAGWAVDGAAEEALCKALGRGIQDAIDRLSSGGRGCFVKTSSRSPKDAGTRTGTVETAYRAQLDSRTAEGPPDADEVLWMLCEAEREALRFSSGWEVIRTLVCSERIWQDMTLALRHPDMWQQNIIVRRWEPVDVDMEFRMFICKNKLNAISQYAYQLHSPRLLLLHSRLVDHLSHFYADRVRPRLAEEFHTCVIDVGVHLSGDEEVIDSTVIEINPFLPTTDGGLFSWETERDILRGEREGISYPVLRVNEKSRGQAALVMIPRDWRAIVDRCR